MPYVWSTVAVAAAALAGVLLRALMPLPNLSLLFLLAVLFPAVRFGMWPAIYASFLSFLAYNFFFIQPLYTFTVAEPYELLALIIFLIVAVLTSALAGRVRDQARAAAARMRATRRLYEFTRKLSGLATPDAIADGAAGEIHTNLARQALILLAQDGLALAAAWPPEDSLDPGAMAAAQRAYDTDTTVAFADATGPAWLFLPLRSQRGPLGVVGLAAHGAPLDAETRALLDTLVEQAAAAIERAMLAREMVSARSAAETERVRNTLLASVSHDFRTPLASILGAATSLIDYGDRLTAQAKAELLAQVKNEAEGLDEMVRNLLAITRIDAGGLELRRDWVDLREVVERVVRAARRRGAMQRISATIPTTLPMVQADALLAEQALANVVSNAVQHTGDDTAIMVEAAADAAAVSLSVTDDGPGIPAELLPRAFDKFVRLAPAGRAPRREGTGLGLAIAKGVIEAHGGSIAAESPVANGGGTRIVLTFPRETSR